MLFLLGKSNLPWAVGLGLLGTLDVTLMPDWRRNLQIEALP